MPTLLADSRCPVTNSSSAVLACLQAMLPPPAAAAMEHLDLKKAMAILMAMDPNKAADVLTGVLAMQLCVCPGSRWCCAPNARAGWPPSSTGLLDR
jgi:hypothetical protein